MATVAVKTRTIKFFVLFWFILFWFFLKLWFELTNGSSRTALMSTVQQLGKSYWKCPINSNYPRKMFWNEVLLLEKFFKSIDCSMDYWCQTELAIYDLYFPTRYKHISTCWLNKTLFVIDINMQFVNLTNFFT